MLLVERMQQEVLAQGHQEGEACQRDQARFQEVARQDAEHVAEQDVVEMHIALHLYVENEAQPEHAGKDDAEHRVFLDAAVFLEEAGRERAGHARGEGADGERDRQDIGQHDAGKDRVRDRIPHQRPALQDEEAGEDGHGCRNHQGHQEGALHEVDLERQDQQLKRLVHAVSSSVRRRRRRAASMPCLGANTKAARKISVCITTMMPPVAPSRK